MRSELRNRAALISYEIARQKVDWGGGGRKHIALPKSGGQTTPRWGAQLGGGGGRGSNGGGLQWWSGREWGDAVMGGLG